MLKGRYTCEQLKTIRSEIAKANGIDYAPAECHFQGNCRGTCPACEAELSYIERELSLRQKAGKAIKIVGLATSLLALSAQPMVAQERQELNSDSLVWETCFFEFGSLRTEYEQMIEEMAEFVNEYPDKLYLMIGHTDERGSESYNLKLSTVRAKYMIQWIKQSCNKDVTIVPVGLAFLHPVILHADTEPEHEQNRRASLEVYNPNRYKGKAAALVELALYAYFSSEDDSNIEKYKKELDKVKSEENYDRLAAKIKKAREEMGQK